MANTKNRLIESFVAPTAVGSVIYLVTTTFLIFAKVGFVGAVLRTIDLGTGRTLQGYVTIYLHGLLGVGTAETLATIATWLWWTVFGALLAAIIIFALNFFFDLETVFAESRYINFNRRSSKQTLYEFIIWTLLRLIALCGIGLMLFVMGAALWNILPDGLGIAALWNAKDWTDTLLFFAGWLTGLHILTVLLRILFLRRRLLL